jgi:hypothetical protein
MREHDGEGRQDLQVLLEDEVELAAIHRIQPEADAEGVEHRILRRVGLFDRRNCEVEQFFIDYRHRVSGPIFDCRLPSRPAQAERPRFHICAEASTAVNSG